MEENVIKIRIVPEGLAVSAKSRDFELQNHTLKSVFDFARHFKEPFDILVYANGEKIEEAVLGANNTEKRKNLKIFLQNYTQEHQIKSKDPKELERSLK